ncbi:MAG: hypothetical protein ACHQUB_03185 [Candidatus Saccharimonadia bacterium]
MQLNLTDELFRADDGSAIVFFTKKDVGHLRTREITISPDGAHFYELQRGSGTYSGDSMEVSYTDRRNAIDYVILRDRDLVSVNGKWYNQMPTPEGIDFIPLFSTIRVPEYLFALPDGEIIYVSADMHHYTYKTFRFFIGPPASLREVPVLRVDRYRDGGTTYVRTEEGTLFSPTRYAREGHAAKAAWTPTDGDAIVLRQLDHSQVNAVETDLGVTMAVNPLSIPALA